MIYFGPNRTEYIFKLTKVLQGPNYHTDPLSALIVWSFV